jgi:hypothetical protein
MIINVTYDPSVGSAPAGFTSTVNAVIQYFETEFTNPITINIGVGYGEVGGQALGSGALGESQTYLSSYTYSQLTGALSADATSAADQTALASLPSSNPAGGANYWVPTAEAKALGLAGASSSIDGYVGFSSAANIFDYNNADGVTAGQYDFYGVVAHEISEVMGRIIMGGSNYTPLSLFDYSAAGVRDMSGAQPGYFSINGGTANLDSFNSNAGGDLADWASSAGNDAFLAFAKSGVVLPVTQTDLTELDVIGWNLAASGSPPPPPPPPPPPNPEANESPEAPRLTVANHSVGVAKFGSASLPITVAGVDGDDTVFVTIKGLTRYESITDNLDHKTFMGSSITLTAAEVASGLTLKSAYTGRGTPLNTLTVTASNTASGEAAGSAAQTINVTVGSTTVTHAGAHGPISQAPNQSLALITQFMAAGLAPQSAAPSMTFQSAWDGQQDGSFLAGPQHHLG